MRLSVPYIRYVPLLVISIMLCIGCAASPPRLKNIAPPPDFMTQKGTIGIIWIPNTKNVAATVYEGYNTVAKNVNRKLHVCLQNVRVATLVEKFYLNVFAGAFSDEGFEVKTISPPFYKSFPEFKKDDYKQIAEKLHVRYLLLLEILAFGVGQDSSELYSESGAIGLPRGFTAVTCSLIDSSSNDVIGQQHVIHEEFPRGMPYESPGCPYLIEAVVTAFEKSIDESFIRFFGRAP